MNSVHIELYDCSLFPPDAGLSRAVLVRSQTLGDPNLNTFC